MTARQARKARRAAERETRKTARQEQSAASVTLDPEFRTLSASEGQANSATHPSAKPPHPHHSTGPRTQDGKNTSRWNSFKHGLYSKQLVLPGEDPAELDALRAALRAEHQPANATEEILVNEIAEQFWRLRRMRQFEARGMQPEEFDHWFQNGLLALIARQMASAERGMHKAITALRRLQLDRGFVPSKTAQPAVAAAGESEFVSQNDSQLDEATLFSEPISLQRKSQSRSVPSFLAEDLDDSVFEIPDHLSFSPPSIENAA